MTFCGVSIKKEVVVAVLRILLGVFFAAVGFSKAASLPDFILAVKSYSIVPGQFVPAFVIVIISFEISFGFSMALGFFTRFSSMILCAMLLLFLIGIIVEMAGGSNAACGCFGIIVQEKVGVSAIIRDLLLLSAAVWISFEKKHPWSIDHFIQAKHSSQTH